MFPNPFLDKFTLTYYLDTPMDVSVTISDMTGRTVQKLQNTSQPAGSYSMEINLEYIGYRHEMYILKLKAGDDEVRMKVVKAR